MTSDLKKAEKIAEKVQKVLTAKRALRQGISLKDWFNPRSFFTKGLIKFDELPMALNKKNECPNCGKEKFKEIKKPTINRKGIKEEKGIYKCSCICNNQCFFSFRPFEEKE